MIRSRKITSTSLVVGSALRREENPTNRSVDRRSQRFHRSIDRLRAEHHSGTAPIGPIVHTPMTIG
jgi:hypothetical protein